MQLQLENQMIEQKISGHLPIDFLPETLHLKICELACLGTLVSQMTLEEFCEMQKAICSGLSLKQSILALTPSAFTNQVLGQDECLVASYAAAELCNKKKYQMIYPGHYLYPESFLNIDRPPKLLTYLGAPAWLSMNRISVVGSRDMSGESRQWMELYFDRFLKKTGAVTVSGAAFGIDQLVHRLSIRNFLPSIAFLPSGLSQIYPRRFIYDIEYLIEANGAVISEFLPNVEMKKHHFERRNRLISGLCKVLFVVEARRKSGSIMTARLALTQGRTLCVLPSSPIQTNNLGNLDLLFDGAHPLRDEIDLIQIMT